MNYNERFNELKKHFGITNKDVAEITGNTPDSIRTVTSRKNGFPRMLKMAVWVYEEMLKNEKR